MEITTWYEVFLRLFFGWIVNGLLYSIIIIYCIDDNFSVQLSNLFQKKNLYFTIINIIIFTLTLITNAMSIILIIIILLSLNQYYIYNNTINRIRLSRNIFIILYFMIATILEGIILRLGFTILYNSYFWIYTIMISVNVCVFICMKFVKQIINVNEL